MNYNYHTHTYLCGHASGTFVEYIEKAISGGIEYMGFSDHIPHINKDGTQAGYRVPYSKAKEYVTELSALREKYRDKIEISIGFESEYYPDVFSNMVNCATSFGGEYLILGQHFLDESNPISAITSTDSPDFLEKYVLNVTEAIKSKVFTYVAHPDMLNFTGDKDVYCEQMRKICRASLEYNIPLEINFLGIRDNRNYPNEVFWEVAGQEKSPVTFGFDAHTVDSACDRESKKKAEEIVKKYNLNYIGKPEIIKLKKQ